MSYQNSLMWHIPTKNCTTKNELHSNRIWYWQDGNVAIGVGHTIVLLLNLTWTVPNGFPYSGTWIEQFPLFSSTIYCHASEAVLHMYMSCWGQVIAILRQLSSSHCLLYIAVLVKHHRLRGNIHSLLLEELK